MCPKSASKQHLKPFLVHVIVGDLGPVCGVTEPILKQHFRSSDEGFALERT